MVASGAGLLIIRRLQRSVSVPVVALAQTARRISEEKDYTLRAPKSGDDEIGQLAEAFNHMLDGIRQRDEQIRLHLQEVRSARDELEARVEERTADLKRANGDLQVEMQQRQEAERKREEMQSNLVEASRKAGMADVATGVLHNVGNVLNSVNVSTQIVHDAVRASRVATLAKAADLLQQHGGDMTAFLTNDERGRKLPEFFCKLAGALTEEHAGILKEIDGLASNIAHIREIVAMQQSLSRVSGIRTRVTLGELLEDAIKINHAGLSRHQVTIVREFDAAIPVVIDRHNVLQILINLVSNAKYAVNGSTEPVRRVILRAVVEGRSLRIAIVDNGVGIDPKQMTRIFGFGFTTKKNGHGFGLHSSALAAKELGGSLEAFSKGLGKGATFTLTMPLAEEGAHVH
jgi:C4-dicarboxylate-specific signal transduction histidine kinase